MDDVTYCKAGCVYVPSRESSRAMNAFMAAIRLRQCHYYPVLLIPTDVCKPADKLIATASNRGGSLQCNGRGLISHHFNELGSAQHSEYAEEKLIMGRSLLLLCIS